MFKGKILVITGGTGSFGNAVLKRFLGTEIKEIRVFSRDEKKQDDMRKHYNHPKLKFYIGDVRNPDSLRDVLHGADFVFNAAALKQVPTCEYHPYAAVMTNIAGPENIVRAIQEHELPVETVVGISTDKACKPVNVMGMTQAIQDLIQTGG